MVRAQGTPGPNFVHVVEPGDTLWEIACLYFGDGNTWSEISAANGDVQPASLQIGQRLKICAAGVAGPQQISSTTLPSASPSWTPEDDAKWEAELQERLKSKRCAYCGSNKITIHLRGRPFMPYVEWNKKRSAELGWKTLSLAGCTNPGGEICANCGKNPSSSNPPLPPRGGIRAGGATQGGFASIISREMFENGLFPNRNKFYTYDSLVQATLKYPLFCRAGSIDVCKREAAAFLANIAHETGDLKHVQEVNQRVWGHYCQRDRPFAPGKTYHGRGPIQLSWNYNYDACGKALGIDLINNPGLVASDPNISFATAIWFWMTEQPPKPSCHSAIRTFGFGQTINIINGGLECGKGYVTPQAQSRINRYQNYAAMLAVSPGANLSC